MWVQCPGEKEICSIMEILKLDEKYAGESTTAGHPVNTPLQLKCWKYKEMDKGELEDRK